MDLTLIWKTVLIGVVEGLTEFLPVSSTGHIILAEEVLHFEGPPGKVFEIVIQLGAILAVCLLYRAKIWRTVGGVLRREPPAHALRRGRRRGLPAGGRRRRRRAQVHQVGARSIRWSWRSR